jgi:hypothetical protein
MKTSVKSRMDLAVDLGVEFACRGLAQAAAVSSPTPQPLAFSVAILGELLLGRTQPIFSPSPSTCSSNLAVAHIAVAIQLPGLRLARNRLAAAAIPDWPTYGGN